MKFCPTCQTRYDEEILRFCTKDGTPLVEEDQPAFTETELPSESIEEIEEDDFSEETVIRRNTPPVEVTAPLVVEEAEEISSPRIVISTAEAEKVIQPKPHVRARTETVYQVQPRKSNTGKIVLLTLLGTFLVLGTFGALFLMTRDNSDDNKNVNANFNSVDTNLNTNLPIGNSLANLGGGTGNFNSNTNLNSNFDANINANTKTPTPTPKPSASPSASPSPSLANTNTNVSNSNDAATPTASPTPKPTLTPTLPPPPPPSPKPSPSDTPQSNRAVNAGILNGRAVNLPKPAYPPIAKQMRASGQVAVQVFIDESGNVTAAKATSGNSFLRAPAEAAARQSKISPVKIGERAVRASGILLYNFINQ